MEPELKERLKAKAVWMRGLYIILFAVILGVTKVVLWAVVVLQFLLTLFTGESNTQLRTFGMSLAAYIYQIVVYITLNSEERPFPFGPWPEGVAPGGVQLPGPKG